MGYKRSGKRRSSDSVGESLFEMRQSRRLSGVGLLEFFFLLLEDDQGIEVGSAQARPARKRR